jgi:exodeoxyribonuclease V beta subunit
VEQFDSTFSPILPGLTLLEASAGTGKTYSLVRLIARHIVEHGLKIQEILVVTFTRAATAEINSRLFSLLTSLFTELKSEDDVKDALTKKWINDPDPTRKTSAIKALSVALASYDQANIFTIDGFLHRVSKDFSIQLNQLMETEIVENESELLDEALDEFWRSNVYHLSEQEYNHFSDLVSREDILSLIKLINDNPTAILDEAFETLPADFQDTRQELFACIRDQLHTIKSWITNPPKQARSGMDYIFNEALRDEYLSHFDLLANGILNKESEKTLKKCDPEFMLSIAAWKQNSEAQRRAYSCKPEVEIFKKITILYQKSPREAEAAWLVGSSANKTRCLLEQLKISRRIQSHNDVTNSIYETLTESLDKAKLLSEGLQNQYKAILIDEFQDTSPSQCEIFLRLFRDPLCSFSGINRYFHIIGDPKQSIYKFRGADVYSYLKASELKDHSAALLTNYRSSKKIIEATNYLFTRVSDPFMTNDRIAYHEAKVPDERQSEDSEAIQLIGFIKYSNNIIKHLCNQICSLLNKGIEASQMAVLVRTKYQAGEVYTALQERGIAGSLYVSTSLLNTPEAKEFHLLLSSLLKPRDQKLLRSALLLPCFVPGHHLKLVDGEYLVQNPENLSEIWQQTHQHWNKKGILSALRFMDRKLNLTSSFLHYSDGERKLTNYFHLAELLDKTSREKMLNPVMSLAWYEEALYDIQNNTLRDAVELKISSQDNAIQILTLHKSKGLEFDYVFLPFMNDTNKNRKHPPIYHDESLQPRIAASLNGDHGNAIEQEEIADSIRLFYVGVTRAKTQCYLYHHPSGVIENTISRDTTFDPVKFATESEGLIAYTNGEEEFEPIPLEPKLLQPRELRALSTHGLCIQQKYRTSSFSSLSRNVFSERHFEFEEITPEAPQAFDSLLIPRFWHKLAPGSVLGLTFHAILEEVDFQNPGNIAQLIHEKLTVYRPYPHGEEPSEDKVHELVSEIHYAILFLLEHDLGDGLKLAMIPKEKRLNEANFLLQSSHFNTYSIQKALEKYPPRDMPKSYLQRLQDLPEVQALGFLDGYIDMIFEHKGRYHILDWKTNKVDQQNIHYLAEKMAVSHYYLQYLIYTIALDRMLINLIGSDYDPEKHLGNIYYVYLRGVDSSQPGSGVYLDPIHPARNTLLKNAIM